MKNIILLAVIIFFAWGSVNSFWDAYDNDAGIVGYSDGDCRNGGNIVDYRYEMGRSYRSDRIVSGIVSLIVVGFCSAAFIGKKRV